MNRRRMLRDGAVYVAALLPAWFLVEVTWGATMGVTAGLKALKDPELRQEVLGILQSEGDGTAGMSDLSPEARHELSQLVLERVGSQVNVFAVTLLVGAVAFAVSGFVCGRFTGRLAWVGLVPAVSLLRFNPLVRFALARRLVAWQVVAVLISQFTVCYLFGWLGVRLKGRRVEKRKERERAASSGG